jgi:hypothetical protein
VVPQERDKIGFMKNMNFRAWALLACEQGLVQK